MKKTIQNDANQVPSGETTGVPVSPSSPVDPVDLAGEESFPASDLRAWTVGTKDNEQRAPSPPPVPNTSVGSSRDQVIDLAEVRVRRRGKTAMKPQDPIAKIYRPAPNVMQSGRARTRRWALEFLSSTPPFIEPLMGWTGSADMRSHVSLSFDSREQAVTYAQRQGLAFFVAEPHDRRPRARTYADSFIWEIGEAEPS